MTSESDFLRDHGGERHPGFKFVRPGDICKGVIVTPAVPATVPNINTGEPETKLVVGIATEAGSLSDGQPVPAGETFAVWMKQRSFALSAWAAALQRAGVAESAVGGRVAFKFSELKDTGKPQPAKVFVAQYEPPVPAVFEDAAAALTATDLL